MQRHSNPSKFNRPKGKRSFTVQKRSGRGGKRRRHEANVVEASPSVATRRLTFSEAKALPRTCPEVPRYAPNQRDTFKVKVFETYALLDSGVTHSFIADDIAGGYPQQVGRFQPSRRLDPV